MVRRDLLRALRKKRPDKADNIENVLLHQDNAPPHVARRTELELDVLGIGRLGHAPYSPDLAPLDFAFFPKVKGQLRGIHFDSLASLRQEAHRVVATLDGDWYRDVFNSWVNRHEKCINASGRYFEKE